MWLGDGDSMICYIVMMSRKIAQTDNLTIFLMGIWVCYEKRSVKHYYHLHANANNQVIFSRNKEGIGE